MWQEWVERFEEQALPASWIDEVFESQRRRQYPRELLFSSVVELMLLVTLGLRPSLHAAVRKSSMSAYPCRWRRCTPRCSALNLGCCARWYKIAPSA